MSRISVRTYGRTIAGATNRLSVRTDGRMHGQLQWKAPLQWIASVYIRTNRRTHWLLLISPICGNPCSDLRMQRIVLAYVRTDGCMYNCSERPLCNESPQCTYVRTEEHTDCYWSVLSAATQVLISGCSDMGWGIERQLKLNSSEFGLMCNTYKLLGKCWSESSLGAQSFCWFCHEAAHIKDSRLKGYCYAIMIRAPRRADTNEGVACIDWTCLLLSQ